MNLTPAQTARTDQELAAFGETLTMMVACYPEHAPDEPRAVRVGVWAKVHSGLTHQQAMLLLALAVERLAR